MGFWDDTGTEEDVEEIVVWGERPKTPGGGDVWGPLKDYAKFQVMFGIFQAELLIGAATATAKRGLLVVAGGAVIAVVQVSILTQLWMLIANDPARRRYKRVVRVGPTRPQIPMDFPYPWSSFESIWRDLPDQIAVANGVLEALERVQGAQLADDDFWAPVHHATLAGLVDESVKSLYGYMRRLRVAAQQLGNSSADDTFGADVAKEIAELLDGSELLDEAIDSLLTYGWPRQQIDQAIAQMKQQIDGQRLAGKKISAVLKAIGKQIRDSDYVTV
jgi:hypothetical protein